MGAGVAIEPADHEFLTVDTGPTAPRKGTEIQFNDIEVVRKKANKAEAMERIGRYPTPADGRTGLFVSDLGELFETIPHHGQQGAEILVYETK
jgi:hypothetical protein